MARILPVLLFTLLALPARADISSPGAVAFDYGFFCSPPPGDEIQADDTIEGSIDSVTTRPDFMVRGDMVPAFIGISFGVHVRTAPDIANPVTFIVHHPPMGPDGVTEQSWTSLLSPVETLYSGYRFEYDYELVTGTWTLEAVSGEDLIYSIDFEVVDPNRMPLATLRCGREELLS